MNPINSINSTNPMNPIDPMDLDNPMLSALCPMRFSRLRQDFFTQANSTNPLSKVLPFKCFNSSTATQQHGTTRKVIMLIRSCLICKFHEFRLIENERMSFCQKENCYSRYSKCVANKALNRFLEQESSQGGRSSSAITHPK